MVLLIINNQGKKVNIVTSSQETVVRVYTQSLEFLCRGHKNQQNDV